MSSGKAKKRKRMLRRMSQNNEPVNDATLRQVFCDAGSEEITEDLIRELTARGWPGSDIREFARMGARYSRPRDSFIFPPEVFLPG